MVKAVIPSEVQNQIDTLKRTLEDAEEARRTVEARALETASQARKSTERSWRIMMTSAALVTLILVVALGLLVRRRTAGGPRRRRRRLAQQRETTPLDRLLTRRGPAAGLAPRRRIALAAGGIVLVGNAVLLLIWAGSGWGPQAVAGGDRPSVVPWTEDSATSSAHNLRCALDADRSQGHLTQTDGLEFQFDTVRACVAGRTPYATVPGGYERLLVSETEPRITINRISDDLTTFTQSLYFVSDATWRRHRNTVIAMGKPGCATGVGEVQALGLRLDALAKQARSDLPHRPARESVWRCTT